MDTFDWKVGAGTAGLSQFEGTVFCFSGHTARASPLRRFGFVKFNAQNRGLFSSGPFEGFPIEMAHALMPGFDG